MQCTLHTAHSSADDCGSRGHQRMTVIRAPVAAAGSLRCVAVCAHLAIDKAAIVLMLSLHHY